MFKHIGTFVDTSAIHSIQGLNIERSGPLRWVWAFANEADNKIFKSINTNNKNDTSQRMQGTLRLQCLKRSEYGGFVNPTARVSRAAITSHTEDLQRIYRSLYGEEILEQLQSRIEVLSQWTYQGITVKNNMFVTFSRQIEAGTLFNFQ